jgi:hypothetical protein
MAAVELSRTRTSSFFGENGLAFADAVLQIAA